MRATYRVPETPNPKVTALPLPPTTTSTTSNAAASQAEAGTLTVTVIEARGLQKADTFGVFMARVIYAAAHRSARPGKSDPFCTVSLGTQTFKTATQKKTLQPKWNEQFSFSNVRKSSNLGVVIEDWVGLPGAVRGLLSVL